MVISVASTERIQLSRQTDVGWPLRPSLGFGGYQAFTRAYISNGLRKHLAEGNAAGRSVIFIASTNGIYCIHGKGGRPDLDPFVMKSGENLVRVYSYKNLLRVDRHAADGRRDRAACGCRPCAIGPNTCAGAVGSTVERLSVVCVSTGSEQYSYQSHIQCPLGPGGEFSESGKVPIGTPPEVYTLLV